MFYFKKFFVAGSVPEKGGTGGALKKAPIPTNSPKPDEPVTPNDKELAKDMARYGITRVGVDYYHYGAFRYTSLKDAVAEAKRASHR